MEQPFSRTGSTGTRAWCPWTRRTPGSSRVAHTLPARVDPELDGPVTWQVGYRIPWRMLRAYAAVTPPAPGVLWRANFYKCADSSSHPHWLTWAPIEWPKPDFHRKEFFGTLAFADRR